MNEIQLNDRTNKRNYELEELGFNYDAEGNLIFHKKGGYLKVDNISREIDTYGNVQDVSEMNEKIKQVK